MNWAGDSKEDKVLCRPCQDSPTHNNIGDCNLTSRQYNIWYTLIYNTVVLKKVHTHLYTFIGQQWRTNKLQKVGHYWHLQTEKFLEISNFNRFDRQVYLCLAALLEMKKHNCIVRPTAHNVRAGRIGTIKCPWRGWTLCWSLCVKCRLRFPGPSTLSEE